MYHLIIVHEYAKKKCYTPVASCSELDKIYDELLLYMTQSSTNVFSEEHGMFVSKIEDGSLEFYDASEEDDMWKDLAIDIPSKKSIQKIMSRKQYIFDPVFEDYPIQVPCYELYLGFDNYDACNNILILFQVN